MNGCIYTWMFRTQSAPPLEKKGSE
uniref:Uncharacterized protein n=1 Tax=Anguilla anguilla TaxID=7936 RepID=A0A0E9UNP1_ANGAN